MSQDGKSKKAQRSHLMKSFIDVISGTIAGINVTLVGHPFDTLKVRLQTQPQDKPVYSGLKDCFLKTIKWEGIRGLYKGMSSPLVGQMFFRSIFFLTYGESKRYLGKGKEKLSSLDYFISGSMAWGIGTIAECPLDFFKTQIQIQIIKIKSIEGYVSEFNGMADCVRKVIKANGVLGAYQGVVPHLIRNFLAGSVHFGLFENYRLYQASKFNCKVSELPIIHSLIGGAIGGWFFWMLIFPLDVIKSAIQSDSPFKDKKRFKGIVHCYQTLMNEGGIARFFKGFSPCMLRAIPANAVLLLTGSYLSEHL